MKISFLTDWDTNNPSLRSGVPYHIAKAFNDCNIEYQSVLLPTNRGTIINKLNSKFHQLYFNRFLATKKGLYDANWADFKYRTNSKLLNRYLRNKQIDALFTIKTGDFAYIESKIPKFMWIDNTFDTFINTPYMPKFERKLSRQIKAYEERSLKKTNKIFTASHWLKNHIINQYGICDSKISVIERGSSINPFTHTNELKQCLQRRNIQEYYNILFITTNWIRKGGNKVLETCHQLSKKNVKFKLHIIGENDHNNKTYQNCNWIIHHGKLNKNDAHQKKRFIEILKNAHVLFVPTLAEGFGIIYAEAAATGVPSVATNIMGVSSSVINNITGQRFDLNTSPEIYANFIADLLEEKSKYTKLCLSSYHYYQKHFRWKNNIAKLINEINHTIQCSQ